MVLDFHFFLISILFLGLIFQEFELQSVNVLSAFAASCINS